MTAYSFFIEASKLGNVDAKLKVGWGFLLGGTLSQDLEKASKIFQELADSGVPDAHMVSNLAT